MILIFKIATSGQLTENGTEPKMVTKSSNMGISIIGLISGSRLKIFDHFEVQGGVLWIAHRNRKSTENGHKSPNKRVFGIGLTSGLKIFKVS